MSNLRMRVFAGPNGSGKSTIIQAVKNHEEKGIPVDFGTYVNADDIAADLLKGTFNFTKPYKLAVSSKEFSSIAIKSGLLNNVFTEQQFKASYSFYKNAIKLKVPAANERLAQIIADFLRKKLIAEKRKLSFETVFSHASKIQIMKDAAAAGYKVYLYFVATESPEINKYRVKVRTQQQGHDVPVDKIEKRYYKALDLMYDAAQVAYQAYFFDNTTDGDKFRLFAHFTQLQKGKKWDDIPDSKLIPNWFIKYYYDKQEKL